MRVALIALAFACLSACSTIKIAYNQADLIAAWMADDYFDLTAEQKEAFKEAFQQLHAWHRATQLGRYAQLLESAQTRINAGVKVQDVGWALQTIKAQYPAIVERGYLDTARILASLTDQQLAAARAQFDKVNRKFQREFGVGAGADEQRRLRAKRQIERIEHWTGPLGATQEARIAELSRALPLITDMRQQDRTRRQREFLALLAERKQAATFPAKLRHWLLDWDRSRSPEYEAQLSDFVERSARMYVDIFALLSPEQRGHLAERLARYIRAARELAQETPSKVGEDKRG